ncbi:MAG: ATP synthase F1 subunit gamma [Patescibacteria group bacterium]|nr:ATP synthase F1 subunit gamma [Patescibacteria group bacterium]
MANLIKIKQSISSVRNTQQITKAMEAVSAVKMRKSQQIALGSRPYSVEVFQLLQNLKFTEINEHWLFQEISSPNTGLLLVTSDKSLCGGYNSNVLKKAENFLKDKDAEKIQAIAVGKKAINFCQRRNLNLTAKFTDFGDFTEVQETSPLAKIIMNNFQKGEYQELWVSYTNFVSTMVQEAVIRKILPIDLNFIQEIIKGILPKTGKYSQPESVDSENNSIDEKFSDKLNHNYLFEPSSSEILDSLIPVLFQTAIHHIILESNASEHSARRVAMKNASDNAEKFLKELTLTYNKARQAAITTEITEIISGKEAMS